MTNLIQVLLVDDHTVVRTGLRALLENETDIKVVGEAKNGHQAYEKALNLRPDVIVMDITMPDQDGIDTTRQIVAHWPQARVLALTMHEENTYLVPFLEAGGVGYIRKSAADRDLVQAIKKVSRGEIFLQQGGLQTIIEQHQRGDRGEVEPSLQRLSKRERQILELVAKGFTSREIGEQLHISPRTVETHRSRIMEKLDLEHRSQLVEFALRHKLLE